MSYCANVIDYLYFSMDLDDNEIIDIALEMICDCLSHMEENESEEEVKEMKVHIHNEMLVVLEGYEYVS